MAENAVHHFQGILERLTQELQTSFNRRADLVVEDTADTLDQVEHAAYGDLVALQLERSSMRCRELRAALRRIDDGTFGMCLGCDSKISIKRLNAVPWTSYCITCQEWADRNGRQTQHSWIPDASLSRR